VRKLFLSRYRCRDCQTQFWGISRKTYLAGATVLGVVVLAALAVFLLDVLLNPEYAVPSEERSGAVLLPPRAALDALAASFTTPPTLRS
jgi:hypothetical protein